MIVVSDTTPLNYLIIIGRVDVLPRLYGRVVIPEAVFQELKKTQASISVRAWTESPPEWLEVRKVSMAIVSGKLDAGELAALTLAEEIHADLLLMDERSGREEAVRRNLRVIGTLGVLADAASHELIDLSEAIEQLRQTNFHVSPQLLESLLNRFGKS